MMQRLIFALLLIPMFLTVSCDIEMSDNGNLDGYWQLASVDTIDGGSRDMIHSRVFWSVQMNLLQLNKAVDNTDYLMRFDYKDVNLRVFDPYLSARNTGDEPVTDIDMLRPYGVNSLDEEFEVETLTSSKMVLTSSMLRLYFNRY